MLDSPKIDSRRKTYTLSVRTAQLEADHGILKNTEYETSALAIVPIS